MAEEPSIIRTFKIAGLHGYKDVELDFQGPAKIVIAENGSGKTTILSALYAFLRADFDRLRNLSFEYIQCHFVRDSEPLQLARSALPESSEAGPDSGLAVLARYARVGALELRELISELDLRGLPDLIQTHPILREIYYDSPFDMDEMVARVQEIRVELEASRTEELKALADSIQKRTKPFEILYLPTYRRVELPLTRPRPRRRSLRPQSIEPSWRREGFRQVSQLSSLGIQFGLADVDERLTELLNEIQGQSNIEYRRISANIIDELLAAHTEAPDTALLPDIDALSQFFSRIEQSVHPERRLDAIKRLYASGDIRLESNSTLRYFLSKLSRVVEQTRELEENIEQFVEKANTYLQSSSEEKKLRYDANRMKVLVQNLWTGGEVKLDDLSSGEKQVVSLLAHLYLYPAKKFLLIDEPELSLSIDWQRRLLPDALGSPTCAQLLAITHSPFIFENELDPYAGPMKISRRRKPA